MKMGFICRYNVIDARDGEMGVLIGVGSPLQWDGLSGGVLLAGSHCSLSTMHFVSLAE